jgi:transposase
MKVNYQEIIDLSVGELKIIWSEQRTITNRPKIQALYWLKTGSSPSLTDVAERLGVHRITVHRWLKQYSVGGLPALLKIGKSTGRHRGISKAVIAGLSEKLSEESCEFKSSKEIGKWGEEKYQISVKYQTLHKQLHSRMKAKLKFPRPASIKKDKAAGIEFKKN